MNKQILLDCFDDVIDTGWDYFCFDHASKKLFVVDKESTLTLDKYISSNDPRHFESYDKCYKPAL